jgi:hypothetical protein
MHYDTFTEIARALLGGSGAEHLPDLVPLDGLIGSPSAGILIHDYVLSLVPQSGVQPRLRAGLGLGGG